MKQERFEENVINNVLSSNDEDNVKRILYAYYFTSNTTPTARFKIRSGDKQDGAILWQTPELVKSFENTGWGLLYTPKTNKFAITPPNNRSPREQK